MEVRVVMECREGGTGEWIVSDEVWERVGFRTVETNGRHILLNGEPIFLRGVLHWGHEPQHIAPAAPPEQVRAEMERLQAMGFNCICLCMWYAPRYFYEIADELGMLLWQEHPCWHSPMDEEYLPEYRRLFAGFMKRDRNRPSVVIVSAVCEHPCFDEDLAAWWWQEAKVRLPAKLHQVQTSSFAWSDPDQTDLYDEHTYDNNDRWVCYLQDLQDVLGAMDVPKPFVMGESVLFTSWPDLKQIEAAGPDAEWWQPRYLASGLVFEESVRQRYGEEALERFRKQAERYHLLGRKFQIERFRSYAQHAGLVTNHLRDVPPCSCGFMDDFDRWRFEPGQTRGWLADVPLILETPGHRRGFGSGERVPMSVRVSNLSGRKIEGLVELKCAGKVYELEVCAEAGEVGLSDTVEVEMPVVDEVTRVRAVVRCDRLEDANEWDLWVFPRVGMSETALTPGPRPSSRGRQEKAWRAVRRMTGLPFTDAEREWDALEKGYSRGFGIEARSWMSVMPDAGALLPDVAAWAHGTPIPDGVRVIVAHRLTTSLMEFMEQRGGRVVLLASKGAGGMGTRYEWLFGGQPLVVERGPVGIGESHWIVDLLGMDLTRRHARVMPVEESGLAECVEPLVRLVYTHDETSVKMYDFAWMARVGAAGGLLVATSLDHGADCVSVERGEQRTTLPRPLPVREAGKRPSPPAPLPRGEGEGNAAGQYLLRRMVEFCVSGDHAPVTKQLHTVKDPFPGPPPQVREGVGTVLRRLCADG